MRKTILFATPYFPPHGGGLERYVLEMGKALQARGWRIVVVTSTEGKAATEEVLGLTVYRLPYQFKISNTPFSFKWFFDVSVIIKKERPALVNVHMPVPGLSDIAAFLARVPLIVTYHSGSMRKGVWWIDVFIAFYESLFLPRVLRKARHIITASDASRTGFLAAYREKCTTVSPAVDCGVFFPAEIPPTEPRLLFVSAKLSRSYAHKGFSRVFAALRTLHDRGIKVGLDVVGEGDMRATYEREVHASGLGQYVHFHGMLENGKLSAIYRQASIFVLPTTNDSYPIAVLEALASGVPVIATRVGDIPRMVEHEAMGFLFDVEDAESLVEKIALLMHDRELRVHMGAYAREKTCAHSTWVDRAKEMESIMRPVLEPRIVHVCGYYPPHIGGIERVASTAARMLSSRGHAITVITSGGPSVETSRHFTVHRLATIELAHTPFTPTLLMHLLTLPRKSLLHVHFAQAYWPEMVRIAAFVRGFSYIAHFHLDVEPSGMLGPLFRVYKRFFWGPFLRGAVRVIVCSEAQKEWVMTRYRVDPARVAVIPNAVADTFFGEARTPPEGIFRLLSIGRLTTQKRVDRLIDACTLTTTPVRLTIAGDGEDRPELEARAQKQRLTVTFAGTCDDTQMRKLHARNDVFLIASEREGGTPLTVLEAAAAGLPIIAGNASGVRELVQGFGMVVEPDPHTIANAIDELFRDPERYRAYSRLGIRAARMHSWDAYVQRLEELYSTV